MALPLTNISNVTSAATALSNLILVSPQATKGYQPQNPASNNGTPVPTTQPPALLFHYEGEQSVTLTSDITDHYVEDNTARQDMISLHPEIIATHGFIGELNDIVPGLLEPLALIANKLTIIGSYAPQLSVSALNAYNEAFQAYQVVTNAANAAVSSWNSLSGGGGENVIDSNGNASSFNAATGQVANSQNKQQVMFQQFYGYWSQRTLFTVQTPWAIFKDVAINSCRAVQSEETNVVSDFELTFKVIRTASTIESGSGLSYSGRLQQQGSSEVDTGTQTPIESISVSQGLASVA